MTYAAEQDTDTPLARWRFDETSGTTFAEDIAAVTATLTGAVTPGSLDGGPYTASRVGADFAGGHATVTGISAWRPQTIEALVRFDTVPSTSSTLRPAIFQHDGTASAPIPLTLAYNIDGAAGTRGRLGFGYFSSTSYKQVSAPASSVVAGALHHIVGVYDGSTGLTLYVDGTQVASGTVTARGTLTGVSGTGHIGRRFDGTAQIDGRVYDLALYNGALSAGRVAAHWAAAQELAGLDVDGGGDLSGWDGTPTAAGVWSPASLHGGGGLSFFSPTVGVGSPGTVQFTPHPGDFVTRAGSWVIEESLPDGTRIEGGDHSTHVYTPGPGSIERVIGSVVTTRTDSDLIAVVAACEPTITAPGPAHRSGWVTSQLDWDVQAGDGAWPAGLRFADNLYLAWARVSTTVTLGQDETLWWGNLCVIHRRYDYRSGLVDAAAAPALDVQAIVHDLMGRGLNAMVEFDPHRTAPGTPWGTLVPHAAWWDGVSAREVLEFAVTWAPGMWWAVWEPGPSGLPKFEVGRWDGPVRYVLAPGSGVELSGGAADLANRCLVRYVGTTFGNTRTVWVAEVRANVRGLADAGLSRTMTLDLTGEGLMTTVDARARGVSALRQAALARTAGRVTVTAPIYDHVEGRMVDPWEVRAGSPVVVSDAPLAFSRSTSLAESVGSDGVSVFRCRGVAFDAGSGAATLTLDGGTRSLIGRLKTETVRRRYDVGSART